ncbi:MAG: DUF2808 domain-containing protein [Cyanobacteria bacterium SBLK]|nr:DUF2808 domain-containing protein [Cyanobacteria bacterium SBLK]
MKRNIFIALAIAVTQTIFVSLPLKSQELPSQELPATFRGRAPRIEEVRTSSSYTSSRRARYYFTIALPEASETPLQKVIIQQRGGQERIRFKLEDTTAFLGTSRDRGETLNIQSASYDESTLAVTVELAEAIAPGTTLSIRLKPRQNPRWGGVYGFGVTVFPVGASGRELYLGARRISFYERILPRYRW